jgi:hypothetical protein
MASKKLRISSLFVLLAGALALTGVIAPGASAEVGVHVTIVNQPTDAEAGDLITAAAFDPTGGEDGYVQVLVTETVLVEGEEQTYPVVGAEVTFALPEGSPSTDLSVDPRFTYPDGIATFAPEEGSENPLSIGTANEPMATNYTLIPVATPPSEPVITIASTTGVPGDASLPFDIWDEGCTGNGCEVNLTPGLGSLDTYNTTEDVGMGASSLGSGVADIDCPTQRVIFSSDLFFHGTGGSEPVFLVSHIVREDMKAATNNGQKHVGWCVGLKDPGPWNFAPQGDLFVGMAPKCPKKNAKAFAPCIVAQMGDNNGGSFIRGWLPGGDPVRRT